MSDPRPAGVRNAEETILEQFAEIERLRDLAEQYDRDAQEIIDAAAEIERLRAQRDELLTLVKAIVEHSDKNLDRNYPLGRLPENQAMYDRACAAIAKAEKKKHALLDHPATNHPEYSDEL